jgi:hypothetical protein
MALSDIVLKARVMVALIRDPNVGSLDIGVRCQDGVVTLTGDVDQANECAAAERVASSVTAAREVRNEMTCGLGSGADTAELVVQRFHDKLDAEWSALPEHTAIAEADYVRWALWLTYKFRIPEAIHAENGAEIEANATEEALTRIAGYVRAPKALVALEMLRQAELLGVLPEKSTTESEHRPLVATPPVHGDAYRAAA